MKWDFWHVVLALIVAIVAAFLVIHIAFDVIGFIGKLVEYLLAIAVVVGIVYLGFRFLVHKA